MKLYSKKYKKNLEEASTQAVKIYGNQTYFDSIVVREKIPEVHELYTNCAPYWPFIDKFPARWRDGAPIDNLIQRIAYINSTIGPLQFKTRYHETTGRLAEVPQGVHVFEPLDTSDVDKIYDSVQRLFRIIEHGPAEGEITHITKRDRRYQMKKQTSSDHNGLFRPADECPAPPFSHCMEMLREYDVNLLDYVLKHIHFCLKAMNLDLSEMAVCQVQFVHYIKKRGMIAHIDNVTRFDSTLGPIFTVNLNKNPKYFDFLPLCVENKTPKRVVTSKGEITMMDGPARLVWAHAIPFDNDEECYTLSMKFPCMSKYIDDKSGGYSDLFKVHMPQHIKT